MRESCVKGQLPRAAALVALLAISLFGVAADPPATATTCETVPPGKNQYRLAVGYATASSNNDKQRNLALAAARESATAQLTAQLCAAMPDTCSRYQSYIQPWQTPGVYDPDKRLACATAVVDAWLLQPDALRTEAERQMSSLAEALTKSLKGSGATAIRVTEVRRSDGCAVPELDPARMWVRSKLTAAGVTVYGSEAPAGTPTLDMEATIAAGNVTLGATIRKVDGSEAAVDPVRFATAAYGVPEGRLCAAAKLPGTMEIPSPSAVPTVSVSVETRGGALCNGQPFVASVTTAAPSRVHVYVVAANGSAWHIWPEPGGNAYISGTTSLGASTATPPIVPGDETLIAVAVPANAPQGSLDASTGFCHLSKPFSTAVLPDGAKVASTSWHIDMRPGACGPTPPGTPTEAQIAAAIAGAPECP